MIRDPRIRTQTLRIGRAEFEIDYCEPEASEANGKLALCLHGFPEHSISWRHQLPMLAELGYRAWAPNLRGYGNSYAPDGIAAYSLECLLADVDGFIDAAGCTGTVLLGHDWGALIAWYHAMRQSRPLERLVILNVPHPAAATEALQFEQLKRSWYVFFFQIPGLPEWLLGRNEAEAIPRMIRESACHPENFPDDVLDVYRRNAARPGRLTAMINYYRALLRGGGASRQRRLGFPVIHTPTLMLWGEEDVALTKETTLSTGRWVSGLTLRYLSRVSHWSQQDLPEVANAMIRAFLTGQVVPELVWEPVLRPPRTDP